MTIKESIHSAIAKFEPTMVPGDEDFDALAISMLLMESTEAKEMGGLFRESWNEVACRITEKLGIAHDRVSQMLTNLEGGGALLIEPCRIAPKLLEEWQANGGEDSGVTACLMVNIVQGRMVYHPADGTYSLTTVGRNAVDEMGDAD